MTTKDRTARLTDILVSIEHLLHSSSIECLGSLLQAGEARVAAEILNEVLYESDIQLPPEPARRLYELISEMRIVPRFDLHGLTIDDSEEHPDVDLRVVDDS
jgi:hypothetical protein